jgi:type II secretory pathway component GspD/PulD (secretin)
LRPKAVPWICRRTTREELASLDNKLFASTNEAVSTSETVVIITPYIVTQPADMARESAEKAKIADDVAQRIRELQMRLERGRPID